MKKLLIMFLFLAISISAQDFRQFKWGDSKSKVKKLEKEGKFVEKSAAGDNFLYTDVSVAFIKWKLMYSFLNGKLVAGTYYTNTFTNEDYLQIKELLIDKYGEQDIEDSWSTNTTFILLEQSDNLTIAYIDRKNLKAWQEEGMKSKSKGL